MMDEKIPQPVSDVERWIVHNRVTAIRVEHRQTGTDTAETYVHLTSPDSKETPCWQSSTFNRVARLSLGHFTLCEPVYGLREKVEARERYEKSNAAELATYKRLKAKYEAPAPEGGGDG